MYQRIKPNTERAGTKPQAVAVLLFDEDRKVPGDGPLARLDRATGGTLASAMKRPELDTGVGAVSCHYPGKGPARVFTVGLGPRERADAQAIRVAGAALLRAAHAADVASLWLILPEGMHLDDQAAGRALADGMGLACQVFDEHHGRGGADAGKHDLTLWLRQGLTRPMQRGLLIGESVGVARRLAATPPNVAHPAYIVSQARKLARAAGLKCRVIDAAEAARLNMNGLLSVGRAGASKPALLVLEHPGAKGNSTRPPRPTMLVGKGITFDTGGYSLKPRDGMTGMKYDKAGGMAVIGAMHAIARLKLRRRVVGLVPLAENMVDTNAYRVDDILTLCNGRTVEVTNTDAEGRLVLADALAWGCRTYKPKTVVDLATLTGGVAVALDALCAGLFSNNDDLAGQLLEAGNASGERLWRLPLWPEHVQRLRSHHADMVNAATANPRYGHAIQGAAFLWHFVGQGPDDPDPPAWAHIDIAGVANVTSPTDLFPVGPTGFGVRLLVAWIESTT